MTDITEINWGFNCLTAGVHHGRPEALWNLPLFQAAYMFGQEELQDLVLARIYNDAMQYVEYSPFTHMGTGETTRFDQEWAERVRAHAEEHYLHTLKIKVGEVSKYYQSPEWKHDQQMVVQRVKANKLGPGYEPRHPHDSINLLCRILGTGASLDASRAAS